MNRLSIRAIAMVIGLGVSAGAVAQAMSKTEYKSG